RRLAVVHRPRVDIALPLPRRAGILAAIRTAGGRMLDRRDEHVGPGARDRQADASLVAGRNAVLELPPVLAAVDGLVDRAAGAAAVESERLAQALIRRRVEHARIARIDHDVGRAGELVDVEDLGPRASGIARLEDAAFF